MLIKEIFRTFNRPWNTSTQFIRRMASGLLERPLGIDGKFHQKYVRVSILGVDTPTGEATAFLLKQNQVISQLYLHGKSDALAIAADLKQLDTRCEVKAYQGKEGLPKAIRRADIILIMGMDKVPANATAEVRLRSESERLVELAEACSRYAPKSIITVSVRPVAATLPLVAAIFRRTHWYHPARIIGSAALVQIKANSMAARYQDLDPASVHVPLVGGPDSDCVVPLFSRATPVGVGANDSEILHDRINLVEDTPADNSSPMKFGVSPLSEAFALNRMVTTMGFGLCGDKNALCTAYVRQSIIATCRHLVSTVQFGAGGVVHNYGVPRLTKLELKLLEKAALLLKAREQMALDLLKQMDHEHTTRIASIVPITKNENPCTSKATVDKIC